MIISRTPFRISFLGGGTDYAVWSREQGGAVLSTSIDKYAYITCRRLPPFFEHHSHIAYSKIDLVADNDQIEHPSVRECLRFMHIKEGLSIHHEGDLPARTGIGSSSSFTVGLLHTLHALQGRMPTKQQLATEAIHVEQDLIGENVGAQDQVAAAFGGFNYITFGHTGSFDVMPVILPAARLERFAAHLALVYTGISRNASQIAASQVQATPHRRVELLAMRQMVDEGLAILSGDGELKDFGELLHEGWLLKRSLTDNVSTSVIDDIYATARTAGALGGKLLGAGGGGFLLLYIRPEQRQHVLARLGGLMHVPFSFDSGGSQIIVYQREEPAPAAAIASFDQLLPLLPPARAA